MKAESAGKDGDVFSGDRSDIPVRRADSGSGEHRPQHISAVAHLFFQSPDGPAARPVDGEERDIAVASPGCSAVAAFAAAGLATTEPDSVTDRSSRNDDLLREDPARLFSATAYVAPAALQELPAAGNTRSWRLVGGATRPGDRDAGSAPRVIWRHLGPVGSAAIVRMSALICDRSLADLETGGGDGLVWCLLENEAASLRSAMLLGSLAALLSPARIEILVFRGFPDGPPDSGRPTVTRIAAEPARRCLEIARRACGDLPLSVTLIDLDETDAPAAAAPKTRPLAAIRDRLLGGGGDGNESA